MEIRQNMFKEIFTEGIGFHDPIKYKDYKNASEKNRIAAELHTGTKVYIVGSFGSLLYIEDENGDEYDIEVQEVKRIIKK